MNINRNNYEEYFLLFADNELTDSEKAEVLMFLKENKDLEEEFRMIHYTICKPDISNELSDKSFLLRGHGAAFINEKNYEEVFVLYHDNELTDNQKEETEDFLSLHTQLKKEFELIGLAKLVPDDSAFFPNKKKLYKKEKTGTVIPLIFWKALVAAVFIGSGFWITELYIQHKNEKSELALKSIPAKQTLPAINKNALPEKKSVSNTAQSSGGSSQSSQREIIPAKEKLQKSSAPKNINTDTLVKTSVKEQKSNQKDLLNQALVKINNETKPDSEAVVANQKIKNIPKEQIAENNKIDPLKKLAQNTIQTDENVQPVIYAQNASYVPDANNNGQNYVFYDITTEEFKKTKVSSFLKKVKRVIERNNPISRLFSEEERQVVSN